MVSLADQVFVRFLRLIGVVLALAATACSGDDTAAEKASTSTTVSSDLAGLAVGAGRLTGQVGPGRPGENGAIPDLTLSFSDGRTTIKATVHDARYTVDLPAGTWEVHSDDGNVCATGLRVAAAAVQNSDLIWPSGSCQDLSGPPSPPSPPPR